MKRKEDIFETSFSAALDYLRKSGRVIKAAKIIGTVIGAGLLASHSWVGEQTFASAEEVSVVMLWVGIVLTLFGSLFLVFVDTTTADILAENLKLARQHEDDESKFEFYEYYIDHALARVSLSSYLREIVEDGVTSGKLDVDGLKKYSDAILGLIVERKSSLFGIEDEKWNFAVYRFDEQSKMLDCLACRRAEELPDGHNHRSWASGEGHVGLSFSRRNELIFSDATRPDLRPVIGAKGTNFRDYDERSYRSLASMPISADGDKPLGILIATSDKIGRYKDESEREEDEWEREDALRETAAFLAILFKLVDDDLETGEETPK
jgi:hypothetical protein